MRSSDYSNISSEMKLRIIVILALIAYVSANPMKEDGVRCIGLSDPCTADYQCCPFGGHTQMCCEFSTTLLDYVCHVC